MRNSMWKAGYSVSSFEETEFVEKEVQAEDFHDSADIRHPFCILSSDK